MNERHWMERSSIDVTPLSSQALTLESGAHLICSLFLPLIGQIFTNIRPNSYSIHSPFWSASAFTSPATFAVHLIFSTQPQTSTRFFISPPLIHLLMNV